MYLLKSPAVVGGHSINKIKLRAGRTADRPVPAVTNPPVNVPRVEAFKTLVQRNPTLHSYQIHHAKQVMLNCSQL